MRVFRRSRPLTAQHAVKVVRFYKFFIFLNFNSVQDQGVLRSRKSRRKEEIANTAVFCDNVSHVNCGRIVESCQ